MLSQDQIKEKLLILEETIQSLKASLVDQKEEPPFNSRYNAIKAAWVEVNPYLKPDLTLPPHIQPLETKARKLDDDLRDAIIPCIQQWEDGLISSSELVDKLVYEAFFVAAKDYPSV